jgi:hypothetical protein
MLGVGVGLDDVLALAVQALEAAASAASNMFGMRRPGSGLSSTPQAASKVLRTVVSLMWR